MDIGGTNLRLACVNADKTLANIESWECSEFSGPADALFRYIEKHEIEDVSLCMAIASPNPDDRNQVTMMNLDWSFSPSVLQAQFSLQALHIINDYHAMALAIPLFNDTDKFKIGDGIVSDGPAVICGPGTGLGVAILSRHENSWQVLPGEGGHMDFAPATEYEQEIWKIFHRKYDHVSAERMLSGPGLEELHHAICTLDGIPFVALSAGQISQQGIAGESVSCEKTLHVFSAMLGSFCGSLALLTNARAGVYIAGGIVPRFTEFFSKSEFRQRFEAKGRYQAFNKKIPTFVVTTEFPGLLGAAGYLRHDL